MHVSIQEDAMHNNSRFSCIGDAGLAALLTLTGFGIIHLIQDNTMGVELAIFITFAMNIAALLAPSLKPFKIRVKRLSAAFAFGALFAAILI